MPLNERERLLSKGRTWRNIGIGTGVVAILAAAFSLFSFHKSAEYFEQAATIGSASDSVEVTGKSAPGGSIIKESGNFELVQTRPCQDGMIDITNTPKIVLASNECGTTAPEFAHNFLANEGETLILDCFYRGTNCPTTFTMSLLSTAATPTETSTWADLLTNELNYGGTNCTTVGGTSCNALGYAAASLARSNTGWSTLDTISSGTGNCTDVLCARVSTVQVVVAALGNWSASARWITIRATSTGEKHLASAQLLADRQLANNDTLNLTYRQAMQ